AARKSLNDNEDGERGDLKDEQERRQHPQDLAGVGQRRGREPEGAALVDVSLTRKPGERGERRQDRKGEQREDLHHPVPQQGGDQRQDGARPHAEYGEDERDDRGRDPRGGRRRG